MKPQVHWIVTAATFFFCPILANAISMIGTTGTVLYKFDSATPGTTTTVTVTGMVAGEKLVGLDFRPANGQVYGTGQTGRLYVIDRNTGAATNISGPASFSLSGGTFGTDISAVDDRLRVISNSLQNIRINLDTGDVAATDATLTESGSPSNVAGLAYTNAVPGASATTAYAIGSADGQLLRIGSVNGLSGGAETGAITKIGSLGIGSGFNQTLGFDIGPNGVAYAAINIGAQLRFYTVNLSTGAASLVGVVGNTVSTTTFTGLTAQTGPQSFANATTILVPDPTVPNSPVENAAPYPSTITVSGLTGVVTKLRLQINDFRHRQPGDVDMLLVSPDGRKMVIWSDAGGSDQTAFYTTCGNICNNQDKPGSTGAFVLLQDSADEYMPYDSSLVFLGNSKIFKPTNWEGTDFFSPGTPTPYAYPGPNGSATFASTFNGAPPNGTWSLYVHDDDSNPPGGVEDYTGRINGGWTLEVTAAPTPTPPPSSLANISTRLRVETGDNVLIGGFIITGSEPKRLILRAIGPSLGLPDKLSNPKLELYSGPNLIASSDNWKTANQQAIKDTTIPPSDDLEAAIVTILNPGAYTAIVSGVNDGTGVGLVEAYDLTPNINSRLANISTRGLVQTGNNVLIAGTIVSGQSSQKVIVRGMGPSLPLPNALGNPLLELRNGAGTLLMANDNWRTTQEAEINATTIPPSNDLESAIVQTLAPGNYTAILQGVAGGTGVGSVEIYALP
jgi:hypothetical protein